MTTKVRVGVGVRLDNGPVAGVAANADPGIDAGIAAPTALVRTVFAGDDMYFEYVQTLPSAQWTVVHNFGKHPNVALLDSTGEEVFADVQHTDSNTVVVTWAAPMTGKVVCS